MPATNHDEQQYLDLVRKIIDTGVVRDDRTKTGTLSIFGAQMRFNLRNNAFPLLTTKQINLETVAKELFWMIGGNTDARQLNEQNVKIWNANGTREYLDSIGLVNREAGDLGPIYGFQWRHSGADYKTSSDDYTNQGYDQLQNIIDTIQNNPNDRRMVMCAWNPKDIPAMALPPCHCLAQFYVANGELSCQLYQRSADMGLGVPFNIASYSLLTILIAHLTHLKPGEFVHTLGDAHVYLNHVNALNSQIERIPRQFPILKIKGQTNAIEKFTMENLELLNYQPYPRIPMSMAV